MRTIFIFILSGVIASVAAQPKAISVSPFSELTISGPFKTTLVKSNKNKVEINYNGVDEEDVIVHTGSDELEIKIEQGLFDFDDYEDRYRNYAIVTVYYTALNDIEVKRGATLKANETLTADRMKLKSSMGSEVKLELKVNELILDSSMGSEVDLSGTAVDFELTAKMGSDVDASLLKCKDVSVRASMGAEVKVFAEREFDASANFGASVTCKGNPSHKKTSGMFGSDFH